MKILFLSTWYPVPSDNGSKLRVACLLHSLGRAHEVSLVSFAFATALPPDLQAARTWCDSVEVVPVDPFVVNRSGVLRTFLSPSPLAVRAIPSMREMVGQNLSKHHYDAVIASTTVTATYALQVPTSTAKILEEHNSLTRWMQERYREQTRPLDRLRCWASWQKSRRYEARLFDRFDLVTMVSTQDQAACLRDLPGYGGHVEVVPNGVDCDHNFPGIKEPQPDHLVFNGSLTYGANYDAIRWFLTDIYPLVKARQPTVSLTITGSTDGVDLAALLLDESIHLTGFVEDVRLPVTEAAVAIAPIRQGGGTRLKILEAMALGRPVVATAKGAEGLDAVDGEHLLLADTPLAFANALQSLLADAEKRDRLAQNARRLVESQYDWAAIGKRFVRLVEETVETRRMAPKSTSRGRR